MGLGLLTLLVCASAYQGVQPICTRENFQAALGSSSQDDQMFLAQAVFDDYLEQIQAIDTTSEKEKNLPPAGFLAHRMEIETKADTLFDDLIASLGALSNSNSWNMGIVNLRRVVLLKARESTNPWPATVWVDVPSMATVPNQIVMQIDSFLQANIDEDRRDRFTASITRSSDSNKCREHEKKAMARWIQYVQIIEPYIDEEIENLLYPQLTSGENIHSLSNWINNNVDSPQVVESAKKQIALWNTVSNKRKQIIMQIVKNARERLGFDPWSRGCGQPMNSSGQKIKNDLLQKSAEMQEFNNTTYDVLLELLSPEQRQQFEDEV